MFSSVTFVLLIEYDALYTLNTVRILTTAATRIPDTIKDVTAMTRVANFDPIVILVV